MCKVVTAICVYQSLCNFVISFIAAMPNNVRLGYYYFVLKYSCQDSASNTAYAPK